MHRTQLYLEQSLYRALAADAARQQKTLSEVVRERLRRTLKEETLTDPVEAIRQATGLWAARDDIPSTERYLRELRRDSRGARHGRPQTKRRSR